MKNITIPNQSLRDAIAKITPFATNLLKGVKYNGKPIHKWVDIADGRLSFGYGYQKANETAAFVDIEGIESDGFFGTFELGWLKNLVKKTKEDFVFGYESLPSDKSQTKCGRISVQFGKHDITLNDQDGYATDFTAPKMGKRAFFALTGDQLSSALNHTIWAAAHGGSHRRALNGVCFEMREDGLYVVATDGHRMAIDFVGVKTYPHGLGSDKDGNPEVDMILGTQYLAGISGMKGSEPVKFYLSKDGYIACARGNGIEMFLPLVKENFPDWRHILPDSYKKEMSLDMSRVDPLTWQKTEGRGEIHFDRGDDGEVSAKLGGIQAKVGRADKSMESWRCVVDNLQSWRNIVKSDELNFLYRDSQSIVMTAGDYPKMLFMPCRHYDREGASR